MLKPAHCGKTTPFRNHFLISIPTPIKAWLTMVIFFPYLALPPHVEEWPHNLAELRPSVAMPTLSFGHTDSHSMAWRYQRTKLQRDQAFLLFFFLLQPWESVTSCRELGGGSMMVWLVTSS